jgi:hypothetical protein
MLTKLVVEFRKFTMSISLFLKKKLLKKLFTFLGWVKTKLQNILSKKFNRYFSLIFGGLFFNIWSTNCLE